MGTFSRPALLLALAALTLVPASALPEEVMPKGGSATAGADLASLLDRVDDAWPARDEPGRIDAIRADLEAAEKVAPDDFGHLWRQARLYFWLSDDPSLADAERSQLGKQAWEYGDRAATAESGRVEGWFFAAAGVGNYALGIGILKALGQGIDGKFRERLGRAERLDPRFLAGGVYNAWGRYYFKLPWPKYDAARSEAALRQSLKVNPENVRGRVYLAELYVKEDDQKEARKLLQEALAHPPGAYDAPEERRAQRLARDALAAMGQ